MALQKLQDTYKLDWQGLGVDGMITKRFIPDSGLIKADYDDDDEDKYKAS